jgi:hypothetical protein
MNNDTNEEDNPDFVEARSHELRAQSEMLLAQAKRLRASQAIALLATGLLDRRRLCDELGISPATLGRLMRSAPDFPVEYPGAFPRFDLVKVRAYLANRGRPQRGISAPIAKTPIADNLLDDKVLDAAGLRRVK